jgi:hypothetical protein
MSDGCAAERRPVAAPGPGRFRLAIAMALLLAIGIGDARAADQATPGQAAAAAVRDDDIQTELPNAVPPPEPAGAPFSLSGSALNVSLWIAILCAAAVLAYFIADILPRGGIARRSRWGTAPDAADPLAPRGGEAVPAAADQLAQQGRFAEAIHALLLQGLSDVRKRLDLRFADSLTSREIVRRGGLPGGAQRALRDIVERVERAYFGTHPTGAEDYRACREHYEALRQALREGARA